MYHYLFTNDLRISNLQSALTKAGGCFVTNTVPSASEDKSENNNMKTLGFYFNLTATSNCAKECQCGNVRKVVLNFIKKFQFPNPRTEESMVDSLMDGITIAPMRLVLQVLYNMHMMYPGAAHLTRDEILDFFFYNSAISKNKTPDIIELVRQIIEYRKTGAFPTTVERDPDKRIWKHEDRQIREMVKLLRYSGCVSENERQELYIQHDNLTVENKAALFDILTYTRFWIPDSSQDYNVNRSAYEKYMDIEVLIDKSSETVCDDKCIEIEADEIVRDYSVNELAKILSDMYDAAENKTTAIHMFGFKYADLIITKGYSATEIVKASRLQESYQVEVNKGISIYKSVKNNEYGIHFADGNVQIFDVNDTRVLGGYNKIFYGAPGCGKSFIINQKLDDANVPEKNRIRVTFHPEYANCDFIGQILPTIEKKIDEGTSEEKEAVKYIFNPGPFTLALERARNTNDMVYLIIEEINRGNAAAIFGDLFQLLDRVKDNTKPNWGESEYPICNVNIQKYLGMKENASLVIPSNLTIFATMNTSDQNVFTLDTAFKRRWSFEQISNNIEKDTKHEYKGWYVPGTSVTLERFLTVMNTEILKYKITSEDKRMGKYFISKDCLTEAICDIKDVKTEAEMFAYKVLEYIWNDVCKISKDEWFDTKVISTLEDLIDAFVNPEDGVSPLTVFKSITF